MRRTLILLLLALALGASVGRAQSVVLVPSRNDDGALCLARVTLDATDAVEAIDTFELPLILGRPPSGIVVHSSGRVLLERRENTVANPNDALDWVTVSAGPLTYEDALTWRGLAPEDWVLEPMNASERKRLWSQARAEIDAYLKARPGMTFGSVPEGSDVGLVSRISGSVADPIVRLDVSFSLLPELVPQGYRNSTMGAVLMDYHRGRLFFFPSSDATPQLLRSRAIQHERYYVGIQEESLLATERELLRADSLAPGIRGQRLIVIDVVEGRKTLESEPFFVGMGREPTISPDGKWVLYSGSLLPFNSGEMPHGGEGLHLIEVATGSMKRLTPPDIQSYQGCWFPDSQRYFVRIYDSPDSRSTDRIAIGDLNGTLTPWKEVQPLVQLVQVILAADVASAWNPNQDRFIAATMAGRDGNQSGERMEFLELNRVSIPDASHSVVAEIPFKSSLVRGRFRSLAWLFPSAAPSGD